MVPVTLLTIELFLTVSPVDLNTTDNAVPLIVLAGVPVKRPLFLLLLSSNTVISSSISLLDHELLV